MKTTEPTSLPEPAGYVSYKQWRLVYGLPQLSGAIIIWSVNLLCMAVAFTFNSVGKQVGRASPLLFVASACLLIFGMLKKKYVLVQRVFWFFAAHQTCSWLHLAYLGKAPRVHCQFDVIINLITNIPRMVVCDFEPLPLFWAMLLANIAFSYVFYTSVLELPQVTAVARSLCVHLLCVLGFLMLRGRMLSQYQEYRRRTAGSDQVATARDAQQPDTVETVQPSHATQALDAGAQGSSSHNCSFQQQGSEGSEKSASSDTLTDKTRMMRPYRSRIQRNRVTVTIHGPVSPDAISQGAVDGLLEELNKASSKHFISDVAVRAGCIVLSWSMLSPSHRGESEEQEQANLAAACRHIVQVTKGWADRVGLPLLQEEGCPLVTVQVSEDGSCAVEVAVEERGGEVPVCRHLTLPAVCNIALHTPALLMPPPPKGCPPCKLEKLPVDTAGAACRGTSCTACQSACDASVVFVASVEVPAHWGPVRGWVGQADSPEDDDHLCQAQAAHGHQAQMTDQHSNSGGDDSHLRDGGNSRVCMQRRLRLLAYTQGQFLPVIIQQQEQRSDSPGVRLVQAHLSLPASLLAAPAGLPLTLQLFQQASLLCSCTTLLLPHTMDAEHEELMTMWMARATTQEGGVGAADVQQRQQNLQRQQSQGQEAQQARQQPMAPQPIPNDLAAFVSDLADWMLFTSTHGGAPGSNSHRDTSSTHPSVATELPAQQQQQQQQEHEGPLVLMALLGADLLQHAVMCGMVSTAETLLHGLLSLPYRLPFTAIVAGTEVHLSPQQQQQQQQQQQRSLHLISGSSTSNGPVPRTTLGPEASADGATVQESPNTGADTVSVPRPLTPCVSEGSFPPSCYPPYAPLTNGHACGLSSLAKHTPVYPPLISPRLPLAPTALQSGSFDMVAALLEWGHALGGPSFTWYWGAAADLNLATELLGVAAGAEREGAAPHTTRKNAQLLQLLLEDGVEGPRVLYELMQVRGQVGTCAEVAAGAATAAGAGAAAVQGAAAAAADAAATTTADATADASTKNAAAPGAPQLANGPLPSSTIRAGPAGASSSEIEPQSVSSEAALPTPKRGSSIPLTDAEGDLQGALQHSSLRSYGLRSWWEAVQCTVMGFRRAPCMLGGQEAFEREFPAWSAIFMRSLLPVHLILVAAGTFVGTTRSFRRGEIVDGLLIGLVPGPFYLPGLLNLNRPHATRLLQGCASAGKWGHLLLWAMMGLGIIPINFPTRTLLATFTEAAVPLFSSPIILEQVHPRAMALERCFTLIIYGLLYVRAGASVVPNPLMRTFLVNGVLWGIEWLLYVSIVRCFLQHTDQMLLRQQLQLRQQQQAQASKPVQCGKTDAVRLKV